MSASLCKEYEEIQELVAAGKSIATVLKETLRRIRKYDPALNEKEQDHLLKAIGWAGGTVECFDIISEKVNLIMTPPPTRR